MNKKLIENTFLLEKYAKKLINKKLEKICVKYDLTIQEIFVIFFLTNDNTINSACDIVKKHCFSKAYISKILTSLVNKNYIILVNNNEDKRYQKIKLLPKSKKLNIEFENIHKEAEEILMKSISEDEYEIFCKVIEKIIENSKNYKEEIVNV
ncbi:MAG: hypothetical protein E7158_02600 [Firmicutes bacterium]|nr:hypothetical protein [Bacillota bacterium]